MKIQSVTSQNDSIIVSAVYDKESKKPSFVSWLQIRLENFVFELGRNMTKGLILTHVNCFPVNDESYVSCVWVPGDRKQYLQRHDVSIYGFLYELQESVNNNVRLENVCSYYSDDILNFLAIWSQ